MTDKTSTIAQGVHDLCTESASHLASSLKGDASPEEITRGVMMGAASFTAAAWVASAKASGIPLDQTKHALHAALDNFWTQSIIPQLIEGASG